MVVVYSIISIRILNIYANIQRLPFWLQMLMIYMLIYVYWCWFMFNDADLCLLMLIDVYWCWLMLIYADWCRFMLIDADWNWLKLGVTQKKANEQMEIWVDEQMSRILCWCCWRVPSMGIVPWMAIFSTKKSSNEKAQIFLIVEFISLSRE